MSLSATLRVAVESAFKAAGDLVRRGSFVARSNSQFDPITETYSDPVVTPDVRMVRTTLAESELEASAAMVSDTKFLVPSSDMVGVDASVQDHILYDGTRYNILKSELVPGGSLWIFYTRKA